MIVLGITGGIATGKSTVLSVLAALRAPTLSADDLARDLLAPGTPTTHAVLQAFPECADRQDPTGQTINRRLLGQRIFADTDARKRLEQMTHPAIIQRLEMQAQSWRQITPSEIIPRAAALEIPLLFEAGLGGIVDRIVVVTCCLATQIARLQHRLNVGEAEARAQIAAQWPMSEKITRADIVIDTEEGLLSIEQQTRELWESLVTHEGDRVKC